MQLDERRQLPNQLRVMSELQVRFAPLLERREAQILQTRGLGPRESVIGEVRKGRPAPERESLPQRLGAALRDQLLETLQIELSLRDAEHVTAPLRRDPLTPKRLAQPGHVNLESLLRRVRRRLLPERIDQTIGRDDLVGIQQEHGKERARLPNDLQRQPVLEYLEWAEDSVFHLSLHRRR